MKKIIFLLIATVITVSCSSEDKSWTKLFNGKNFDGFKQLNGQAPFTVENGCVVGTTVKDQPSSFMATEKEYGDFILEFECEADTSLNSGVQFRSLSTPDYDNGRVHGYQCEIDPSDRAWSGGIYDEARRGWLVTNDGDEKAKAAWNKTGWNKYRVEAIGNSIRIWLNEVNTANLLDEETSSGFIAFQIHSLYGNKPWQEGKQVKFRNIRIMTENLEANRKQGELKPLVNRVPNTLSEEEKAQGWALMFDGQTVEGWRGAHKDSFPEHGWKVENGAITVLSSKGEEAANGGDIVSREMYSAFELELEFKYSTGANSGIKYFVTESEKQKGSAYGLEYQILDDRTHPDAKLYTSFPGSRKLSSLYDLLAARNKRDNGVGQWNLARIVVRPDNHVEHWLNGFKVLEYERGSDAFRELVAGSKYAAPEYNTAGAFGEAPEGRILLQDHGDEVSFRSIKIKQLQ
ncbi:MAG: DUF1080 domain-containing protein [Prevotellaceae bacterium]|jgi:hypothetical protein|nr:DUF1080 domain-containing protein [Prevotellaceae bacterium]